MNEIPDREAQANREVGVTDIGKRGAIGLCVFFLAVILAVPFVQAAHEAVSLAKGNAGGILPSITGLYTDAFTSLHNAPKTRGIFKWILARNEKLLDAIVSYEDGLESGSVFRNAVLPLSQRFFTGLFGLGNGKAVIGKDGWLFYEPGIRYLTEPEDGAGSGVNRSSSKANTIFHKKQTGALDAILDFASQLEDRGIMLIVAPAPVKPMFYPNKLSEKAAGKSFYEKGYLQNPAFDDLKRKLEDSGVPVFDAAAYIAEHSAELTQPVFLKTDTHWSPETVSLVARGAADFIGDRVPLSRVNYDRLGVAEKEITNRGDIANMLRLPETSRITAPEKTVIRQVLKNGSEPWAADRNAEILFLGDSFSNIYSLAAMGWGESAGLVEQLSYVLGRPVDRIVQNDNGAYATRQALQYELSRGRDRLAGKRVVVWEFALRELVLGDWKEISLKTAEASPSEFFTPDEGGEVTATGIILDTSARPVPRTTPYKDHIMTLHLVDVSVEGVPGEQFEVLVYAFSMIDYELTDIAKYRPGEKITLKLKSWFDVMDKYNSINRAEIDDDDLLFEDPCWGEEVIP